MGCDLGCGTIELTPGSARQASRWEGAGRARRRREAVRLSAEGAGLPTRGSGCWPVPDPFPPGAHPSVTLLPRAEVGWTSVPRTPGDPTRCRRAQQLRPRACACSPGICPCPHGTSPGTGVRSPQVGTRGSSAGRTPQLTPCSSRPVLGVPALLSGPQPDHPQARPAGARLGAALPLPTLGAARAPGSCAWSGRETAAASRGQSSRRLCTAAAWRGGHGRPRREEDGAQDGAQDGAGVSAAPWGAPHFPGEGPLAAAGAQATGSVGSRPRRGGR